ncbi:hypothetical protein HOY82DRAFT_673704 [Tuber indicum]|nr:hypothetical protein HOY82DRAFT_673704 [Tuber indicum]
MKFSLVTLFLALATAIHVAATGDSGTRTHPSNEAEHAAGMADAVTAEYKKVHGVTPELEAMILSDGSGGQGTNSYYDGFVPVNVVSEGTGENSRRSNNDGLVIPIEYQDPGDTVVTITSTIVATEIVIITISFTITTTVTSPLSIYTSQEYHPRIPSPIHPTRTAGVRPAPSRCPVVAIAVALPTPTLLIVGCPSHSPTGAITINGPTLVRPASPEHSIGTTTIVPAPPEHLGIPEHPIVTSTMHPTPSFATATIIIGGTSEGPAQTPTIDPISPKPSSSVATFVGSYPTSTAVREVGAVSAYPIPTGDPITIYPTAIPQTTFVTKVRNPTAIIS